MVSSFWRIIMLLPSLEPIYTDAMILEDLEEVAFLFTYTDLEQAVILWEKTSKQIEDFIPRVAQAELSQGKKLLDCWKNTLDVRDDFRAFSAAIKFQLIPILRYSLNILYGPIVLDGVKWHFEKTPSGFVTLKDQKDSKFIHSPYDPMREAAELAQSIYSTEMDEYHILGCGLGYFPYQMWIKSDKSCHIYVYEDDEEIIEYAKKMGVLSWIDDKYLTIVHFSDVREIYNRINDLFILKADDLFISDWKVNGYYTGEFGKKIEDVDFSLRTIRDKGKIWSINARENKKLNFHPVEDYTKLYGNTNKECVVVSAGPSLDDCIEFIRESKGKRVIIAINAVLKRLEKEKIIPDIVAMLSPNKELSSHIEGIEGYTRDIPMIMPLSGSRTFAMSYEGPLFFLNDDASSEDYNWVFGGTVASLALCIAYYLKASKVYLIGSDLAFSGGKNYSSGGAHSEYEEINNDLLVEATDGGMVKTKLQYNVFRDIIENQIAQHPETKVYNLAKHGAKISGTISELL